jgi:hypothetical protein
MFKQIVDRAALKGTSRQVELILRRVVLKLNATRSGQKNHLKTVRQSENQSSERACFAKKRKEKGAPQHAFQFYLQSSLALHAPL